MSPIATWTTNTNTKPLASTLHNPSPSSFLHFTRERMPKTLEECKQFHAQIFKLGFHSVIFFINSLIHRYGMNGSMEHAHQLFDASSQRDVVSWTTLVSGYSKSGKMEDVNYLFDEMPQRNVVSWNAMISGHGRLGDMVSARQMFDEMPQRDIVSWNSMISGYARNGFSEEAFEVFRAMRNTGVLPNMICSNCGCLDMALLVFESNSQESTAPWNAMLAGFVRNNWFEEALEFFQWMQMVGVEVDYITMVTILPAITSLGMLGHGKWVHSYIERKGIIISATLGPALVDMYSKCGCVEIALQVFNMVNNKTIELWNAMIAGLAMHGRGKDALRLFLQMQMLDLNFDGITVTAVLNACSHSGLVDEGLHVFDSMKNSGKINLKIQHYGCVVDLLGRAGLLEEAIELIRNMPIKPDAVIWKSLLGACKIQGNVEIGELVAGELLNHHPIDSSSYVLMSNIYDVAGHLNDAIVMRKMMNCERIQKAPGCSWIELDGMIHEFLVGDKSHPRSAEIYAMLDEMAHALKLIGYVPNTKLILFDIDEEEKETALYHHSERLAVALGLINTAHRAQIRIIKNLRMCRDCHLVMKLLSRIYDREIIIRVQLRFHHFRSGTCSCMDYW